MATIKPGQIKTDPLLDSAKMLVVQDGEDAQEHTVKTIRGVDLPEALQEDIFHDVQTEVYDYAEPTTDAFTLEPGSISTATGAMNDSTTSKNKYRRSNNLTVTKGSIIECAEGYKFGVYFYTGTNWQSYTGYIASAKVGSRYVIKGSDKSHIRIVVSKSNNANYSDGEAPTVTYTAATSRISALEDAMETMGGTVETLGGNVETLGGTVETLDSTVETLGGTVETLSGNVESLSGTVDALDGTVENNSKRIDHLEVVSDAATDPTRNLVRVKVGNWYPNASGKIVTGPTDQRVGMAEYIPCDPSTDYVVSAFDRGADTSTMFYVAWKDSDGAFIQRDNANRAKTINSWHVTSPENAAYMCFSVYNSTYISQATTKLQIEVGETATDYIPPYSVKDSTARDAVTRLDGTVETLSGEVQGLQTEVEALDESVDYLMQTDYPDYFQENLDQAVDRIHDNMMVGLNGESFVFITDVHWGDNQKHSPALIRYILNHTNVRNVICGGDLMDGSSNAAERAKAREFMEAMRFCPGGLKHVAGNHDYRHGSHTFTSAETYSMFYPQAEMEWQDMHTQSEKIYGYFDVPATKTRCLNIGMPFGLLRSAETPWLESQIADHPEMNIIIFAHYLFNPKEENGVPPHFTAEAQNLMKLCSAYSNVRAIIYGHIHADKVDYTPSGIPVICVDGDQSNPDRMSKNFNPNTAEVGTITEQAFDAMTVNLENFDVQCVRVGRGKSRSVHGGTTLIAVEGETTFTTEMSDTVWRSSDTSIATVADGVVTGVAQGMAVICAAGEDTEEFWSVTVGDSIGTVSVAVGGTAELTPIMLTQVTTGSWQSANPEIASVAGGIVTGVAPGKTAIRASGMQNSVANMLEFWDVTVTE